MVKSPQEVFRPPVRISVIGVQIQQELSSFFPDQEGH